MTEWGFALENLTASWHIGVPVFQEISLRYDFSANPFLPLVGATGGGKSTFLYVVAALKWPSDGKVQWTFPGVDAFKEKKWYTWEGNSLSEAQAVALRRRHFGFAFQDSSLAAPLTVEENLLYPLLMRNTPSREAREMIRNTLSSVLIEDERKGLEEILRRFPHELSGGQRQRVALAQAMIHNPDVLFADEPGGNLDYGARLQVMRVLSDWIAAGEGRRGLVWATHHLDDPSEMGVDQLLYVGNGNCTLQPLGWLDEWKRDVRLSQSRTDPDGC